MRNLVLRQTFTLSGALLAVGALAACSSSSGETTSSAPRTGELAGLCPETVVIQADWEPEAEHGGIYQLLGTEYTIDKKKRLVSGPLMHDGQDTGVDVEIRIGGSSVGYQAAQSLLYQDRDIMLGYGRTSEYMVTQKDTPVTAVIASMEKSPYAIYWDPATYPDVTTLADLGKTGATISTGPEQGTWLKYLVGTGQISESQVDQSDQNKPAKFVAAKGKLAEAGFLTAEPHMYEEEIAEWGKPVTGQLIADTGYPEYFQAVIVRADDVTNQKQCLEKLVPIMQQAQVDYMADPTATNELVVELVDTYDTGWVYTESGATYAHKAAIEDGILADSAAGVMGQFDLDRVQTLIDIVSQYSGEDVSGIAPGDLVTNEFIDESISTKN